MSRLPPLRLLTTFQEVARLGSMRAAAQRLNVTQPAITQALHALEDHLGVPLLDRSRRPAQLTEFGHQLARATADGLDRIASAIEDIRAQAGLGENHVTVACTLGMATYWLMPRLPEFYERHPGITVNVQAPPSDLPLLSPGIDIALRYGRGGWSDGRTRKLFDEVICPVGTPALVAALAANPAGLAEAPLIHVRGREATNWAGWPEYLRGRGMAQPRRAGQSFDNYVQAVQEALNGRGLMLGWRSITGGLVAEGVLVPWPDGALDLGTAYFVTDITAATPSAAAFGDWLFQSAATS